MAETRQKPARIEHSRKEARALCSGHDTPPFLYRRYNMEITEVLTAISTVGFPIVFCLIMFWYLREESENHKTEMSDLKSVIADNNTILASLKQLIDDRLGGND